MYNTNISDNPRANGGIRKDNMAGGHDPRSAY